MLVHQNTFRLKVGRNLLQLYDFLRRSNEKFARFHFQGFVLIAVEMQQAFALFQ